MTEKTEVYVPSDYAEALSQIIGQRIHGGPSSWDRYDLRTLQVKLSRAANDNSGGDMINLTDGELSWFNYLQRSVAMAHSASDEFGVGVGEAPWMPTREETYWGKRRLESPEGGQRWRSEDKIMELVD